LLHPLIENQTKNQKNKINEEKTKKSPQKSAKNPCLATSPTNNNKWKLK